MLTMATFTRSAAEPCTLVLTACLSAAVLLAWLLCWISASRLLLPLSVSTCPVFLAETTQSCRKVRTPRYSDLNFSMNLMASIVSTPSWSARDLSPIP